MNGRGELEAALNRFHQWLASARTEAAGSVSPPGEPELGIAEHRPFGLIDLVEEFTALRQELKLQTKSARSLQEQAESLLPPLRQAIEHIRSVNPKEEQAVWAAGKPIAEALATLDEALDRCRAEIEKAQVLATEQTPRRLVDSLDRMHKARHWLRRYFLRRFHREVRDLVEREVRAVNGEWLELLLEGFDLIQNRVRRVLKSEAIEPIICVGLPVDPERMIVIETTDSADWPPQIVIDELRRGYTWRSRILRLAEVRAVRGRRKADDEQRDEAGGPSVAHDEDEPVGENGSQAAWLETE